jgi:hypothetical protein
MSNPPDDTHFKTVAQAALDGQLTFFIGAGANFAQETDSAKRATYSDASNFLPMGAELARHLANEFNFTAPESVETVLKEICAVAACVKVEALKNALKGTYHCDLEKVTQQVQSKNKDSPKRLTQHLHGIFSRDFQPTDLHKTLAHCAKVSRFNTRPVFITTNYDTMMEQALASLDEPFDVLYYRPPGPRRPVWLYHWQHAHLFYKLDAANRAITKPGTAQCEIPIPDIPSYLDLPLGSSAPRNDPALTDATRARSLVVKFHGTVSPLGWERSSFVISPDDYIDFLRLVSLRSPLPSVLERRLIETHFLFLGYGLGDWNILAICHNLWNQREVENYSNYAVQRNPSPEDERRWATSGAEAIELLDSDATAYSTALKAKLPQ